MNLTDAQAVTDNTGQHNQLHSVRAKPRFSQPSNQLHKHPAPRALRSRAKRRQQPANQPNRHTTSVQQSAQTPSSQPNTTAIEEIVIVVAATSLIVLFVMLYTVRERTKEIGTLKAIGFSNSTVMGQFLIEGIVLSIIAGVVGITIGVLIAPQLAALLLPSMNLFGILQTAELRQE